MCILVMSELVELCNRLWMVMTVGPFDWFGTGFGTSMYHIDPVSAHQAPQRRSSCSQSKTARRGALTSARKRATDAYRVSWNDLWLLCVLILTFQVLSMGPQPPWQVLLPPVTYTIHASGASCALVAPRCIKADFQLPNVNRVTS